MSKKLRNKFFPSIIIITILFSCINNTVVALANMESEPESQEQNVEKLEDSDLDALIMNDVPKKSSQEVSIKVTDTKIYINTTFDPKTMIVSATDDEGLPIPYEKIDITGSEKIDFTKFGVYEIGFSYQGSPQVFATLTVSEGAQIVAIKDTYTSMAGLEINAQQLVSIAKSIAGTKINYNDVNIKGSNEVGEEINLKNPTIGTYNVSAFYEDVMTEFIIKIQSESFAQLLLKEHEKTIDLMNQSDIDALLNDPFSLVDSLKDIEGNDLPITSEYIDVTTNLKKSWPDIGDYYMTFKGSNGVTETLNIHLVSQHIKLETKDAVVTLGNPYKRELSLVEVIDQNGKSIDINHERVKQEGTVDTTKVGSYQIAFNFRGVKATANVTVEDSGNHLNIDEELTTRYQNDLWSLEKFVTGGSYGGEAIDKNLVSYEYDETQVDTVGQFTIKFSYKDLSKLVTITVLEDTSYAEGFADKETYSGKYTEMYTHIIFHTPDGKVFNGGSMFYVPSRAEQYNAKVIATRVEGNVSTDTWPVSYFHNQEGIVEYTFYYRNKLAGSFRLTVHPDKREVVTKNSNLVVNEDSWDVYDNVISVVDNMGNPVEFSELELEGSVPTGDDKRTNKIGKYYVKYSYKGRSYDRYVSSTAEINVIESAAEINVRDMTVYYGDDWNISDPFVSGLTNKGDLLNKEDIGNDENDLVNYTITDAEGKTLEEIDTTKEGIYTITYKYSTAISSAKLRVVAYDPTIKVHNSDIYVHSKWSTGDNFDGGYARNGQRLNIQDITVTPAQIDTSVIGMNRVTYTYENVVKIVTVNVVERKLSINTHDLEIPVDSSWDPKDNFTSASKSNGDEVSLEDIEVTILNADEEKVDRVDTSKAGTYTINYFYEEEPGISVEANAKLIIYSLAALKVMRTVVVPIYEEWDPSVAFLGAITPGGKIVEDWEEIKNDVEIIGEVDTSQIGTYDLIYQYEGISKDVTVKIDATKLISITLPVEIIFNNKEGEKEIESKMYEIKNNSDKAKTEISFESFTEVDSNVKLLGENDPNPEGIEDAARLNLITSSQVVIFGLTEKSKNIKLFDLDPNKSEKIGINGEYFGDLSGKKIVDYRMSLKFAHVY